jgi:hypothetical protein
MPWHHIIPKHEWKKRFGNLKGVNAADNLVELRLENHTEVHLRMGEEGSRYDRIAGLRMLRQIGNEEAQKQAARIWNSERQISEETRKKWAEARIGKINTEESKRKCAESLKGRIPWHKGTKGLKPHSEESKQKQSASMKAKWKQRKEGTK